MFMYRTICIVSAHESYDTICISYESYLIVKSYVLYRQMIYVWTRFESLSQKINGLRPKKPKTINL